MSISLDSVLNQVLSNPPAPGEDRNSYNKRMRNLATSYVVTLTVDESHRVCISTCTCGFTSKPFYGESDDQLFDAHMLAASQGEQHFRESGHKTAWPDDE